MNRVLGDRSTRCRERTRVGAAQSMSNTLEVDLRAPVKVVVHREWVELAALLRREENEPFSADELYVQVWLQIVVAVIERARGADKEVDLLHLWQMMLLLQHLERVEVGARADPTNTTH